MVCVFVYVNVSKSYNIMLRSKETLEQTCPDMVTKPFLRRSDFSESHYQPTQKSWNSV